MKTITVVSGFGYFTNADEHIIAKAVLPKGKHPLDDAYDYVEVADQAALEGIEVYKEPHTPARINEEKIQAKIRSMAIESLKAAGELPLNFEDVKA